MYDHQDENSVDGPCHQDDNPYCHDVFISEDIGSSSSSRMEFYDLLCNNLSSAVSVSVSAQDSIVALGKGHTRSASSLSSLPKVVLETVPMFEHRSFPTSEFCNSTNTIALDVRGDHTTPHTVLDSFRKQIKLCNISDK